MEHLFGVAEDQGASKEEIGAVEALVMNASAGRVRAQFREARVGAKKARKKGVGR